MKLGLRGRFRVVHCRKNKILDVFDFDNGIVDQGANLLLDVMFGGTAASDPWYFGLIDNAGFTALANADTMASHAGWAESVAYTEANRIAWVDDTASARIKTNLITSADFSINAAGVINGIFVTNDNIKGGAIGSLWSTASFNTPLTVANLDVLRVQYTLTVG